MKNINFNNAICLHNQNSESLSKKIKIFTYASIVIFSAGLVLSVAFLLLCLLSSAFVNIPVEILVLFLCVLFCCGLFCYDKAMYFMLLKSINDDDCLNFKSKWIKHAW